jgi:hypothetical protein
MPRRTRKQLVGKAVENEEINAREKTVERLQGKLRKPQSLRSSRPTSFRVPSM